MRTFSRNDSPLLFSRIAYAHPVSSGDKGAENVRSKSLTGTLHISLRSAHELDHAPLVSRSRSAAKAGIDTFVHIKVDGTQRTRSHNSKTDRWNEDFDIPVDKATEIEIAFYDKQASEVYPIPIGLLWIRISDLVEALRRQRVMGGGQGGWVTANAMGSDATSPRDVDPFGAGGGMDAPLNFPGDVAGMRPPVPGMPPQEGVEAFFSVEPVGAVALRLNFSGYSLQDMNACRANGDQPRKTYGNAPWKQ